MENERNYLNCLKGFLIVLVVIGHFGQTISNLLPDRYKYIGHGFILFIYSFHMPLFLFVSGYLSKNLEKRRSRAVSDLLIPYLLFQLVCGCSLLVITKSSESLRNIFVPQMGAWYLLALFGFRLLLPELTKVRGVVLLSIVLSVLCPFLIIGKEFALQKSLGFFAYFIIGYTLCNNGGVKSFALLIPKWIARILLLLELAAFIVCVHLYDCYQIIFSVFTRSLEASDSKYFIFFYITAFAITTLTGLLVMNAISGKNRFLEKQGMDTMPMYLSHLLLFMAAGYLVNKKNVTLAISISCCLCLCSLIIFATKWYRKVFNSSLQFIKKCIFRSLE